MPVTIKVAPHQASKVRQGQAATSLGVLKDAARKDAVKIGDIIQTSLPDSKICSSRIRPINNGLVHSAFSAYTSHHHLVLRPEDIWFAILTQFSFFVNAHAEELRSSFVSHQGKMGLILEQKFEGVIDYGSMCQNMTRLIEKNIVDPKLRSWVLPSFTTTTETDEVVASILMMGTLQKYFEYCFDPCTCGIPTVTLLGEKSDYEEIQRRIEKLTEYGEEPTRFTTLLRPILKYMVATFGCTTSQIDPVVQDFWSRIIHYNSGSGMDSITGWMVAFCFWDENGKCLASEKEPWRAYASKQPKILSDLDNLQYHEVEIGEIPAGYVSAPVELFWEGAVIGTRVLAGSVGIEATPVVEYFQHDLPNATTGKKNRPESISKPVGQSKTTMLRSISSSLRNLSKFRSNRAKSSQDKTIDKVARLGNTVNSSTSASVGLSSTNEAVQEQATFDSIQPVTGWWMYKVAGGETGESVGDFLGRKMATEWTGMSKMRVEKDGA